MAMLTAIGTLSPDIKHLLNIVKVCEVSVPSTLRVFLPLMEIGILSVDQCTSYKHGEVAGKNFVLASELKYHNQS